ncbi:hypothetical protein [Streptomyces sp. NPDC048521]
MDEALVLVRHADELSHGERYRNVEAITVREGLVREVRIFFGGRV